MRANRMAAINVGLGLCLSVLVACGGAGASGPPIASPTATGESSNAAVDSSNPALGTPSAGSHATPTAAPTVNTRPSTTAGSSPAPTFATESNPPGDIPDNQAFVSYTGAGFTVQVPEGWSRVQSHAGAGVVYTDKLNSITIKPGAGDLTSQTAKAQLRALTGPVPAFAPGAVSTVRRNAGSAVLLTYQADSAPNPVTSKVVRDAFEQYIFSKSGRHVQLILAGPVGADNVDPWRKVTDSFRWTA